MSIQFGVSENIKKVLRPFSDTPHRLELPLVFISGVSKIETSLGCGWRNQHIRLDGRRALPYQDAIINGRDVTTLQGNIYHKLQSSIDCAFKIYRQYGFRGVFKGFTPTFYRESIGGAFYFGIFEMVSRYTSHQHQQDVLHV
jgi:hypothetical protein